jgi:hypothetical protein
MKGNRHNGVIRIAILDGPAQILPQMPRERLHSGVLEEMNETAEGPFVKAEGESPIEGA